MSYMEKFCKLLKSTITYIETKGKSDGQGFNFRNWGTYQLAGLTKSTMTTQYERGSEVIRGGTNSKTNMSY